MQESSVSARNAITESITAIKFGSDDIGTGADTGARGHAPQPWMKNYNSAAAHTSVLQLPLMTIKQLINIA